MTTWLADASVLLAGEDVDDPHHAQARRLLAGPDAVATLDLAFYEVVNVAVRAWQDLAAAHRLAALVSILEEDGGVVRVDEALAVRAGELAARHGLSGYDAAYVAAAASSRCELVSCDLRDLVSPGFAVTPAAALVV